MRAIAVTLLVAGLAFTPLASADQLSLSCPGTGTHQESSQGSASVYDYSNNSFGTVSSNSTHVESLEASVQFELNGDLARILMPPHMTPAINGGSDGGWWTLDRLEVTPEAINGRFTLNVFNKPTVRIDRMRGTIEVDGNFRYYFLGNCERVETPLTPRF